MKSINIFPVLTVFFFVSTIWLLYQKFQNPENWWLQVINMSGAGYAYPVPEKMMDKFHLGFPVAQNLREIDWRLEL